MERLTKPELEKTTKTVLCNYNEDECNDSCKYGLCIWNEKALHKLKAYEDTGLTPEEIKTLKEQLDISRAEVQGLSKKLAECQKSDADKERYTIELYSRARKAEEKADYWEREAKKWCAKLGEIRLWIGGQN
jgi:hypothetical protein